MFEFLSRGSKKLICGQTDRPYISNPSPSISKINCSTFGHERRRRCRLQRSTHGLWIVIGGEYGMERLGNKYRQERQIPETLPIDDYQWYPCHCYRRYQRRRDQNERAIFRHLLMMPPLPVRRQSWNDRTVLSIVVASWSWMMVINAFVYSFVWNMQQHCVCIRTNKNEGCILSRCSAEERCALVGIRRSSEFI